VASECCDSSQAWLRNNLHRHLVCLPWRRELAAAAIGWCQRHQCRRGPSAGRPGRWQGGAAKGHGGGGGGGGGSEEAALRASVRPHAGHVIGRHIDTFDWHDGQAGHKARRAWNGVWSSPWKTVSPTRQESDYYRPTFCHALFRASPPMQPTVQPNGHMCARCGAVTGSPKAEPNLSRSRLKLGLASTSQAVNVFFGTPRIYLPHLRATLTADGIPEIIHEK